MERLIRLRPGVDSVRISDLMVPLRYDIVIRAHFFQFIDEHRALASSNIADFIELARGDPYHTWFRRIVPFRNGYLRNCSPAQLESAFGRRVAWSVAMSVNLRRDGLHIARCPVTLRVGVRVLPTSTGKFVARPFYISDGCHRLALLLNSGETELRPEQYVVRRVPVLRPVDNTGVLLRALRLSNDVYYRYLSTGYLQYECDERARLLESVRTENPGRLAELEGVLASDEPALGPKR